MITEAEIKEIRRLLKKSEKPMFLYDDDPDGLASFLLLRRYCKKGKGVVVKSAPVIDHSYTRKIEEYRPDRVFVLDKPGMEQEFIDDAGVPIVWIDHHPPVERENVKYFNPQTRKLGDNAPTSHICYKVAQQDMWIAATGILGDHTIPDFLDELVNKYPGVACHTKDIGEARYSTELGRLVKIFSAILKGPTSEVNKSVSILLRMDNPYEILNETTARGKYIHKKYLKVQDTYLKLLKQAKSKVKKGKLLLFTYPSTKLSLTSDLSDELRYLYPDKKVVIVAREKPDRTIMSIRSNKIDLRPMIKRSIEGLDGYSGGHKNACGGNISREDFKIFIERLKKEVK